MGSAWRSGGRSTWRTAGRGCGGAGWGEGGARFRLNAARTASRPTATGPPSLGGATGAAAVSGALLSGGSQVGSATVSGSATLSSEGALPFSGSHRGRVFRFRGLGSTGHFRRTGPPATHPGQHPAGAHCAARVVLTGCRGGCGARRCRPASRRRAASSAPWAPAPSPQLPMPRPGEARARCRNNPQRWP